MFLQADFHPFVRGSLCAIANVGRDAVQDGAFNCQFAGTLYDANGSACLVLWGSFRVGRFELHPPSVAELIPMARSTTSSGG